MATKSVTIHLRLTSAERAAIEDFINEQASSNASPRKSHLQMTESNLRSAIRCLIALGLRATKSPPKIVLKAILQEIDPAWSGRVPRFGKPVHLATSSAAALEELLKGERSQ
jgi:hypothetical protein